MAFENLREQTTSVTNMLDRFEAKIRKGKIEESETTEVFDSVGEALKKTKEKLNDKAFFDSLTDEEVAKLSNPWTAWETNKVFTDAEDPSLKKLQTILTPGENDKQERARRYSRQVWRTEIVAFLVEKMKESPDKDAASARLEKIMAAQVVKEGESTALSALRISMHLDGKIHDKAVREALATEMEASEIIEKTPYAVEVKDLNPIGLKIKDFKVVVGGDLLKIPQDQIKTLELKNIVIKKEENRVYAQLENGCRGNLVIMELEPYNKSATEAGTQTNPEQPEGSTVEDGVHYQVGDSPTEAPKQPEDLSEKQLKSLFSLLEPTHYTVNPIRESTDGKIQSIQIAGENSKNPITIEFNPETKIYTGTVIDSRDDTTHTFQAETIEKVVKKATNEDFTQSIIEEVITSTTEMPFPVNETPFAVKGNLIYIDVSYVPTDTPSTAVRVRWPFPEQINLEEVAKRLNKRWHEENGIEEPEADTEEAEIDVDAQATELNQALKKAGTNYYVETRILEDESRVFVLKDKSEGKRADITLSYDAESATYKAMVNGKPYIGTELMEVTKRVVNDEYLAEYIKTAAKKRYSDRFMSTPIESEFKDNPFYAVDMSIKGHFVGIDSGDSYLFINQPALPFPEGAIDIDWPNLAEDMNKAYREVAGARTQEIKSEQMAKAFTESYSPLIKSWKEQIKKFDKESKKPEEWQKKFDEAVATKDPTKITIAYNQIALEFGKTIQTLSKPPQKKEG